MNYKLIFQLSLFGLAMAISTVFWIPSAIEPFFWFIIFIICAYFIALKSSGKYFMTGFWVSIVNCVWITAAHILFYHAYLSNHHHEAEMMVNMPVIHSVRLMMLLTGPFIGIISGLMLGSFAYIGSKILQKK